MPDKRYRKGCGSGCLRCWQNKMKHGNKLKKKKDATPEESAKKTDFGTRIEPKYKVLPDGRVRITETSKHNGKKITRILQPKSEWYRQKEHKDKQRLHDHKVDEGVREAKEIQLSSRGSPNEKTRLREIYRKHQAKHG